MTTVYRNLARICLAAVLAFGLAACGGGGAKKSAEQIEMERLAQLEMDCEAAGGRFESDESCTSAAELVAEAAQMACEGAGGRYESDGSCTSAADVEAERLAAAEMSCTGAGGRWESDNTCTSAAELVAEAAEANCTAGGGRYESDGSCTSAAELAAEMEMERLAGLRTACEDAGGRFESDESCTSAAQLAEMACTDAGGRYESDGSCTSAADVAEMACTDAGGRYESDGSCTSAADVEAERLAGLRTACEDTGGRFESDESCTSAAELVAEAAEANCVAGGGRYESDGSCTSAAELETERLAQAEMNCTSAGGRWNADDTCTTAAELVAEGVAAAAMSKKLYDGLEHGLGDATNVRTGASDAEGVVSVTIGAAAAVQLAEDKKTMVADNHDWKGKRHTAEPTGNVGTYEAVVYSNVGDPTEGDPFNEEYTLDGTTGETGDITALTGYTTGRVASSRFDQSAGMKTFDLPTNTVRVMLPGMYHGVSGTYYCTPTNADTKCSSTVAESGFTLAGGTWSFKPTTATAKVMSVDDTIYASYGWWLHKSEDGNTYTASAFATTRGIVTGATAIDTLRGTATYMGGAAGKYALYSSTGGMNEAGHFTARAMLEADFGDDTITGTIDNFMGGDGEMRPWSVELKTSAIAATGGITGTSADATAGNQETVWTIDGRSADAAGQWSGTLYDNGDDGVPKVATGTFHSEYSNTGRMVGGFGANKQ